MNEDLLEFPEGWGVLDNIPSVREVWVFTGTTQRIQSGFQRFPKVYVTFRTLVLQSVIK